MVPVATLSVTASESAMAPPTQSRSSVPPIAPVFHWASLIMPWSGLDEANRNERTPGVPWMAQELVRSSFTNAGTDAKLVVDPCVVSTWLEITRIS
jgi:hypothetical protein